MDKKELFLDNAQLLNKAFNITPLLYGSLGLGVLTNVEINCDDIDILIPKVFVKGSRWEEFKFFLEKMGYTLTDEHEHTFCKNDVYYSYGYIEDLESFAGIEIKDIGQRCEKGVEFLLLNAKQYLMVYESSAKDGYRINVRQKKDREKIEFIKSYIEGKHGWSENEADRRLDSLRD